MTNELLVPWGRVRLDYHGDEFWPEVKRGEVDPRLASPLSVTLWIGSASTSRSLSAKQMRVEPQTWIGILNGLKDARVLRLNVAGFDRLQPRSLRSLVEYALEQGFAVVLTALDCQPDLERCGALPAGLSLQVLFDVADAWQIERGGGAKLSQRLEVLSQCLAEGFRVKVFTPYRYWSPLMLVESAEILACSGIQHWRVHPRLKPRPEDSKGAALKDVAAVRTAFPFLNVQYGNYLVRELMLRVRTDGTVRAKEGAGRGRALCGPVAQLAEEGWLSDEFFALHAEQWMVSPRAFDSLDTLGSAEHQGPFSFLAYNRRDRALVLRFSELLKAAGVETWLDESLEEGSLWLESLMERMKQSSGTLVLIGPSGLGEFQQRIEIPLAYVIWQERKKEILPILLPGGPDASELPLELRPFQARKLNSLSPSELEPVIRKLLLLQARTSAELTTSSTTASRECLDYEEP